MVHNWTDERVKYLDIIAHFDISHDAPHWQTTTRSMCEAQTLTNKQDHCVSALDTKKQSEPLWVFNMLKGKRVPYIPKKSGTRKNNTLDPEVQKILEWLSFHWADYFAEPQNSDRQQPSSSSSSWSPSPTWWSSSSWDHQWQEWHSHRWQDKEWWDKRKERQRQIRVQNSLSKLLAREKDSIVVNVDLSPDSICSLADFF